MLIDYWFIRVVSDLCPFKEEKKCNHFDNKRAICSEVSCPKKVS